MVTQLADKKLVVQHVLEEINAFREEEVERATEIEDARRDLPNH